MSKITLSTVSELQAFPSAAANINSNSDILEAAIDNTLSRDGTAPNTMGASLDMNSNRIINLPGPLGATEPLRLGDITEIDGTITVNAIPAGGTTGQPLAKVSNDDYDADWAAITGTGNFVKSTSPTLVTPALGTPSAVVLTNATGLPVAGLTGLGTGINTALTTNVGSAGAPVIFNGALGIPSSGTLTNVTGLPLGSVTGLGSGVATFLATPSSANLATAVTGETGSGALVFGTSPTLATPILGAATATTIAFSPTTGGIIGTTTNDNTTAGNVGEYTEASVASGSAVALTTNVAKTVTSITLGAGDWDISGHVAFTSAATTSFTIVAGSLSLTTDTSSSTLGRWNQTVSAAFVPNGVPISTVIIPSRFSLSGSTTIYLVAFATFTVSTAGGYGLIRARRVR
jgi:hypothetical protein